MTRKMPPETRAKLEKAFLDSPDVNAKWGDLYDLARHDFNAGLDAGWNAALGLRDPLGEDTK